MEFTTELLKGSKYEGKEISIHSKQLSKRLAKYLPADFGEFSSRSFYFWKEQKRPIPLSMVLKNN